MKTAFVYQTRIGQITIIEEDNKLIGLEFGAVTDGLRVEETALLKRASVQINEYFNGARTRFELPVEISGTPFQAAVWRALATIPYGEVWSYKRLAKEAGNEKACRAAGLACRNNPLPIIIPCHRVVGSNGALTGFAGGLDIKKGLLELEREYSEAT